MSGIFKTESAPIIDKDYLADIAQNLWKLQAFQRSVRMFLAELKRPLTGIDKKIGVQEDELMKAIKRGFVVEEEIIESNERIKEYRAELVPWLKKILAWAETGELTFDSYAGTVFEAPPKEDSPDVDEDETKAAVTVVTKEKMENPGKGKKAK